jgi:hypothetical protein
MRLMSSEVLIQHFRQSGGRHLHALMRRFFPKLHLVLMGEWGWAAIDGGYALLLGLTGKFCLHLVILLKLHLLLRDLHWGVIGWIIGKLRRLRVPMLEIIRCQVSSTLLLDVNQLRCGLVIDRRLILSAT